MNTLILTLQEAVTVADPKSANSLLYIAATGLLAAVVYLYIKSEIKNASNAKVLQELNDKFVLKIEKSNEINTNLLEKTLNGLTGVERMIIENNAHLSQKVIDSIKETNAPLITEIKELLKK